MSHTTLRWVVNVSSFPPVPLQIEVWGVSNLTFVVLNFAILHLTTELPFIVLALYFRRSETIKRVNGDATSAVCRQGKYVSEALHAIPNCLWIHEKIVRNKMEQKILANLLLNEIHVVEMCEAGRYKTFVHVTTSSLRGWIPMIIWCDHCLLVALWFRFHIALAKSLLFGSRYSDLIPKCERQKPLITRRERSGAAHASWLYNLVVAWVVWNTFCFFVWHIVMTVMSRFWRYLFVGIALIAWPKHLACWHLSLLRILLIPWQCFKRKPVSVTT